LNPAVAATDIQSRIDIEGQVMLRIGIVGAGENTRTRHIPGLRAMDGVQIAGVVNRTPESTAKVAATFGISRRFATWEELVADPEIDAVVIGTWPNLHAPVTVAALEAGKHVLCEARMARNLAEARTMLAASQGHPDRVAMLVPSPFGLAVGPRVEKFIQHGFLGNLREVVVTGVDDQFVDYTRPLHWRQDAEVSGVNTLALGILHETVSRWIPQPTRVFAQTQVFEPSRPNPNGPGQLPVTVPDSVQIVTQYASGGRGLYHLSGMAMFGPGKQIHLYGSGGTIKVFFGPGPVERLLVGRPGDGQLMELDVPLSDLGRWRVEEEFVRAIRGQEAVRLNDFETGVAGMEFTEAAILSAVSGSPVNLPFDA
jgi:predicted dehydrogenase